MKTRPTPPRPPRPRPERRELKYYGSAACDALWRRRPDDVVRIYIEQSQIPRFGPLLKWAAGQRKAYHVVAAQELERLTESVHHQGICLLARERPPLSFAQMQRQPATDRQLLIYLDGVENPHNLGAIVRTCAHFGARYILGSAGRLPRLSPSACRVAEGGAEAVELVTLEQPEQQLKTLQREGYALVATTVRGGQPLYGYAFAPRSVLILGAEVEGVSAAVARAADANLCIPGSGAVESLNVGVAFGVLAGEYYRQNT